MAEDNKTISRRIPEEAFSQGKLDVLDEVVAENVIEHDPSVPPEFPSGLEGLKAQVRMYTQAFPDVQVTVEDQIAEGDKVVTRWSARGTHEGELMGIPRTGKQTRTSGITIDRIEGGKIVETWTNWDTLGLLQQLGAIPEVAPTQT